MQGSNLGLVELSTRTVLTHSVLSTRHCFKHSTYINSLYPQQPHGTSTTGILRKLTQRERSNLPKVSLVAELVSQPSVWPWSQNS